MLQSIKPGIGQRPNIFTNTWIADYPDAQNWMHDFLSCHTENDAMRPCNDLDVKIDAASKELDASKRSAMYRELEEAFFGKDEEFPISPLFVGVSLGLVKPWFTSPFQTDGTVGGSHWDTYTIDQKAQLAARGG